MRLNLLISILLVLAGCMNMPTPTSQITGTPSSGIKYDKVSCQSLATELSSLTRRENQLIIAQEQRIKSSQMQAFWWGFGNGDGIEASELSNVRSEKETILSVMAIKNCEQQTP